MKEFTNINHNNMKSSAHIFTKEDLASFRKTIAVFGSTGSIGRSTLKIIKENPEFFELKLITAHSNVELLISQALDLNPEYVCIEDKTKITQLKEALSKTSIKVISDNVSEAAKLKVDLSVMAIVGYSAILPTINAIKTGNNIALANKECLVCAGKLIIDLANQHKVKIIPIDSEHSGLFQVFDYKQPHLVQDITLTASGGPFLRTDLSKIKTITKTEALKHPNWSMGAKISIDSATLVNKCLEVIEAYYLFPITTEQIKIIIHPESIIHAIVNFIDGSMLAQLSATNMQIPISYALFYPERATLKEFNQFNLSKIGQLNFIEPDSNKFHSLNILKYILKNINSNAALIFNIANEVAVEAFLNDQISFVEITQIIEKMLEQIKLEETNSFEQVFDSVNNTKIQTINYIKNN